MQDNEDRINQILEQHSNNLSEDQIRCLPLLAFGMSAAKAAKTLNLSDTTIRQWMRSDPAFRTALSDFTSHIKYYHMAMLNQAAVLAWDRVFEFLETNYPEEDKIGRSNQAQTAKFVISELGIMKQEPEKEEVKPQLHVSEDSADIIARKVHELQNKDTKPVEAEYQVQETISDDDPRIVYNSMEQAKKVDVEFGKELELADSGPLHPKFPGTQYGEITYNEDKTKARCHVCGSWVVDLVVHARNAHKLSAPRYREMYRIPPDMKLGVIKPVLANKQDVEDYNKYLDNESTTLDESKETEKEAGTTTNE